MAIRLRRGAYADFDPTKMVPAEVGIVTSGDPNTDDGKAAYVAFSAGNAKRLATVEDIATDLQEATDDAVGQATARAEAAAESVEASATQIATNTADIADLKADFEQFVPGLSDEAKEALLACFNNVVWASEDAPDYISALQSALYPEEYPKIVATYTPGTHVVYMDDSLDSLKPYITVMYYETEQSPGTEIGQNDYILSGQLAEGTSVLTVAYGNMTTRVSITNVIDYYNLFVWEYSDGITRIVDGKNTSHIVGDSNFKYLTLSSTQNRDFIGSTKGNYPLHSYEDYSTIITPYVYPIPIPPTAKKVKIDFTMASGQIQSDYVSQAVIGKLSEYNNEMVYERGGTSAELASGGIYTMFKDSVDVHDGYFLFVPIKSLSSIMPTVTDFTITFLVE